MYSLYWLNSSMHCSFHFIVCNTREKTNFKKLLIEYAAYSKDILTPCKIIKLYVRIFHVFFPQKPHVKFFSQKPPVKKMSKVHLMSVSVAHLLWPSSFWGWGALNRIFFCACGGPPNFFAPGPSNGIKRVGPQPYPQLQPWDLANLVVRLYDRCMSW